MAVRRVDPATLEGDELDAWYRRSPDQVENEREQAEEAERRAFFGDGGWQETKAVRPLPRPPVRPYVPTPSVRGEQGAAPVRGGFFDTYRFNEFDGVYVTGLPAPLGRVDPALFGKDLRLTDGSIVSADEVERLYAEQQRRINGKELEPSPYARAVDRLKDGQIPAAYQLEKGMWERDPTCHPYGGWELDPGYPTNPKRSQDYEAQITGARGVDYVVRLPEAKRGVKFDGCAVASPRHELQEAKGPGYEGLLKRRYWFSDIIREGFKKQADRQTGVAGSLPIQWYVAEEPVAKQLEDKLKGVAVKHVPAR